jgi:hypothetical protein
MVAVGAFAVIFQQAARLGRVRAGTLAAIVAAAGAWPGALPASGEESARLAIRSADGEASIVLSCTPSKAIDLQVIGYQKAPTIQAPDHTAGAGNRNAIQYTVDGQGPFLEDWELRDGGLAPADREQLQAFVARLATGRIMHLRTRGMQPFEFRLEKYTAHFKSFAESCKAKR